MTEWNGLPADITPYIGFVYRIRHKETGIWYCGKKQFVRALKRKPLKGRKRCRRDKVPSNYQDYWGSSKEFLAYVEREGKDKFVRQIVSLHTSKYDLALAEIKFQLEHAINDPRSANEIINVRLRRSKAILNEWRRGRRTTQGNEIVENCAVYGGLK
jgi:hypothetical protein